MNDAGARRLAAYSTAATGLALIDDDRLRALIEQAPPLRSGIGGRSAHLRIDGVDVFAKRIPLTDLERLPGNVMSTANLFGLPGFYQYGGGSVGFGAWRELAAHAMTTSWVLAGRYPAFPLMYHWRILPDSAPDPEPVFAWFKDMAGALAHWDDSDAIRRRLEAVLSSSASIVLFLEYVPLTLTEHLAAKDLESYRRAGAELLRGADFMRGQGLIHFDAHFDNVLTDGDRLYFADFGLALSSRFQLSAAEQAFFRDHADYDRAFIAAHLVNQHVAERVRGDRERAAFVADWAAGTRPGDVPRPAAAVLDEHAATATMIADFHRELNEVSKSAPYPAAPATSVDGHAR